MEKKPSVRGSFLPEPESLALFFLNLGSTNSYYLKRGFRGHSLLEGGCTGLVGIWESSFLPQFPMLSENWETGQSVAVQKLPVITEQLQITEQVFSPYSLQPGAGGPTCVLGPGISFQAVLTTSQVFVGSYESLM
jgi:hypothetical protein